MSVVRKAYWQEQEFAAHLGELEAESLGLRK